MTLQNCPKCDSSDTYEDAGLVVCPMCAHEWSSVSPNQSHGENEPSVVKDAFGTTLQNGDSVTLIKDLKLKGSASVIKVGTKVKGIRLSEGDHNIDCKVDGFGAIGLKSEFVKKI
jgi:protein PhnA